MPRGRGFFGYPYLNDRGLQSPGKFTRAAQNTSGSGAYALYNAQTMPPGNKKRSQPMVLKSKLTTPGMSPSLSELAFDAIVSPGGSIPTAATATSTNWTAVQTQYNAHSTSHMKGKLPAGANTLCADGHVEWRPFSVESTVYAPSAGNLINFWFPAP